MNPQTTVDLSPVLTPVLQVVGTVIASIVAGIFAWGVNEMRKKNLIALTDQQVAAVEGAVHTSAGMITADLARRAMPLEQLHSGSPQVIALAQRAVAAVPLAAAALGVTQATAAQMIIGAVGNAMPSDPTVHTLPAPAGPVAADPPPSTPALAIPPLPPGNTVVVQGGTA